MRKREAELLEDYLTTWRAKAICQKFLNLAKVPEVEGMLTEKVKSQKARLLKKGEPEIKETLPQKCVLYLWHLFPQELDEALVNSIIVPKIIISIIV